MNAVPPHAAAETRPRVEGDRELEIYQATLGVLVDVGYDRLTMDAVATRARASKATLYRRWNTKAALVIDSICAKKGIDTVVPDTGNLRDDLVASYCGLGGFGDREGLGVLAAVITALNLDQEFAERYRREFVEPKLAHSRIIFDRALERGEIDPDIDVDLVATALPGIVLHRLFLLGDQVTPELVTKVIDQIIMPACRRRSTD